MANANILSEGAMPHSRTLISSRVRIFGYGTKKTKDSKKGSGETFSPELVGAISSFAVSSSRNLEPVRGIGLGDHIIEMVPGQSEPLSLQISRAALAVANMFQEFGYAGGIDGVVRALKHHRYPVDVKQEILISNMADADIVKQTGVDLIAPSIANNPLPLANVGYKVADNLTGDANNPGFKALITWYEGCWFEDFNVTYGIDQAVVSEEGTLKVTDVSGLSSGEIVIPYAIGDNASMIWYPTKAPLTNAGV